MSAHDGHASRVQEVFSKQAASFEDHRSNQALTHHAEWLFEPLQCGPQDLLLDVAAGTGHAARSLAGKVRVAVAVDVTEAMLQAGRESAHQQGLANVIFMRGDALALPFLDESFDVVISRFATHHIERPDIQLAEMARCLRPGGRLALADIVADEDPQAAEAQERIERLRDPSHARTVSVTEMVETMRGLGLHQIAVESREVGHSAEHWLGRANVDPEVAAGVQAEMRAEMDGSQATGLRPFERDGQLWLTQTWACVRAVKPTHPPPLA